MGKENFYNEMGQVNDPDVAHEMAKKEDSIRFEAKKYSKNNAYTERGARKMEKRIIESSESEIEQVGKSEMEFKELKEKMKNFHFSRDNNMLVIDMTINGHVIKLELPKTPFLKTYPSECKHKYKVTDNYITKRVTDFSDRVHCPHGFIDNKELSDTQIDEIFGHYKEAIESLIAESFFQGEREAEKRIGEKRKKEDEEYLKKEKELSEINRKSVEEVIKNK